MNSQQEQKQPAPVLAWYKEVVREAGIDTTDIEYLTTEKFLAILTKHDPHATTVRLLEEAAQRVIEFGSSIEQEPIAERLASEIRVHLAALQQEGAAK